VQSGKDPATTTIEETVGRSSNGIAIAMPFSVEKCFALFAQSLTHTFSQKSAVEHFFLLLV
jgi:hypothetical protein